MIHFALVLSLLLALGTGVSARCQACPNCDYEQISIEQGDACLSYWTCSGTTYDCYYPSVANPGTYNVCTYNASDNGGLIAGPSGICEEGGGDNAHCEPANNPYNIGYGCTASYGFVNETNSQLL
ncbi:uncharacterized protein EDB93DRAFT_765375 [Suillus bovinus]|uniref:uncharacterized protein n=1 Tax=Suillus bovinus TaxID=48563 RepID=UPI001B88089B|nr:uncharacterized protein EDB93DRAFT_765375 [Suillus bovinus]KAG2137413.1 hypothetical protein EDB93DRAFT_765375 [Suillus bovinus]